MELGGKTSLGPAGRRLLAIQNATAEGRRESEVTRVILDAIGPLADLLRAHDISQAELARRLGVSRQRVSTILSGSSNLTLETLTRAYHAIGYRLLLDVERVEAAEPGSRTAKAARKNQGGRRPRGTRRAPA